MKESSLTADEKTDLRYYLTMLAACELCGKIQPQIEDLVSAIPRMTTSLTDALLTKCLEMAMEHYKYFGATDKAAKGRAMEDAIKGKLATMYQG